MRDARRVVIVLVAVAAIVGLLPGVIARSRRVQVMRAGLTEVVAECRARYAGARTAADTAAADAWVPSLRGERRPGDPACGAYRRRNMLGSESTR
jgi:hypothetical protein